MGILEKLLSALPQAAKSPLALIAYIAAAITIAFLTYKTALLKRANPKDLPRLIGAPNVGCYTPEQHIRATVHRYYFYAFLALCAVAVIVVAIAAAKRTPEETGMEIQAVPIYDDDHVGFGVTEETVKASFGIPGRTMSTKGVTLDCFYNKAFELSTFFNKKKALIAYSVYQRDPAYQIPLHDSELYPKDSLLGFISFSSIDWDSNFTSAATQDADRRDHVMYIEQGFSNDAAEIFGLYFKPSDADRAMLIELDRKGFKNLRPDESDWLLNFRSREKPNYHLRIEKDRDVGEKIANAFETANGGFTGACAHK